MGTRLELHDILVGIMSSFAYKDANKRVYFQPPPTVQMSYPCIVYELNQINTRYADNDPYSHKDRYTVTVIDKNPDSLIPRKISDMRMCNWDRHFTNDNLHHTVFQLYF